MSHAVQNLLNRNTHSTASKRKRQERKGQGQAQRYASGSLLSKSAAGPIAWFSSILHSTLSLSNKPDSYLSQPSFHLKKLLFRPPARAKAVIHTVLLDSSASVLQAQQFAQAKACIVSIAEQAYLQREQFTVFGFEQSEVKQLLSPRRAPKALRQWLDQVKAGGGTPLREMLAAVNRFQHKKLRQTPDITFYTYILSDGRYRKSVSDISLQGETLFIDVEQAAVKRGRGPLIAQELSASYCSLPV